MPVVLSARTAMWSMPVVLSARTAMWSMPVVLSARTAMWSMPVVLSVRTAMWSMPVVLTEWEKENDLQNQCNITSFCNFNVLFASRHHLAK